MKKHSAKKKVFSNMEVSFFCGQIALILKSGISSIEGITIMLEDNATAEEQEILRNILTRMQETGSFYTALSDTGLFPDYMLQMTQIGEETGTLDEVMTALSDHYEREDAIAKSIKNAVTYPLLMAGMMVVVIVVLLVKVMPMFNQVFIQLGTEMTGFSRILMHAGNVINRYSVLLIALIVLIAAGFLFCSRTEAGRRFSRRAGYKLKFIRPMFDEIAACRFASGMALTLSSGLNPDRSLELVETLNDNPRFAGKLQQCQAEIAKGTDMAEALRSAGVFSGIYSHIVSIGFRAGASDQVMRRIARLYQNDIDNRINNVLAVLEPTMVIALSLIVGVILLSVMLPLMGIMSGL